MPIPTALQITTPSDKQILITRTFHAPRQDVWRAMTEPDLVRRWFFCPPGWAMTVCEMDVRPGGAYTWAWSGPNGATAMVISGIHKEVVKPKRIVHTQRMEMMGACGGGEPGDGLAELIATLELDEAPPKTHMRMQLDYPSREIRDAALRSGMEHGMNAGYATLDAWFAAGKLG